MPPLKVYWYEGFNKDATDSAVGKLSAAKGKDRNLPPLLAELHVASFLGVADDPRKQQVESKAQAPNRRHEGNRDSAWRPAGSDDCVENTQQGQSSGPAGIHNRRIVQRKMNQPQQEHHSADSERSRQDQSQHGSSLVAGRSWLRIPQSTGTRSR